MSMDRPDPGFSELRSARRAGRGLFGWAFLFSVFVNLLMLTGPLYMLQVYDRVLASGSVETLVALSLLVAVLYAVMAVLDGARSRALARAGARFRSRLDARLFDAMLRGSRDPTGQAASRAALRELDAVQGLFVSPGLLALFDLPWTPVFIAAIFVFHPALGWLALAGGGALAALALMNQGLAARRLRRAQAAGAQAHAFADRAYAAGEIVMSQGLLAPLRARFARLRDAALDQALQAHDWTGTFMAGIKAFRMLLQSAMLGLGAFLVLGGDMTPGAMIAGSILLGRALAPVEQAIGHWPAIEQARAGWRGLGAYLAAVAPPAPVTALPRPDARLTAKGMTVVPPGSRAPVLCNIAFDLRPGAALGVIGRSGAGKSALARTLAGYWPLAAGDLRLAGAALDQYAPEDLARYVGYLPQTVTLLPGTVAENIARMAPDPSPEAVIAAARQAHAHELILRLPRGYDTMLDDTAAQLSGGQRQRIGLARALFGDPMVLILDEPNSMLDAEGSAALNRAVRAVRRRGRSVIVMTHRPAAIAECDRLMVIENGAITALGPRDEVLRDTLRNAGPVASVIRSAGQGAS